ncbi:MAG: gamma-glutamyltransferase family protein [Planctomycetota bacterium]
MRTSTSYRGGRPTIMGTRGVVTSGHYLATEAGMHVLRSGGNAFDAAAATGFALTALEPHQNGFGGEVPILLYPASEERVFALSGNGTAPAAATIPTYRELGVEDVIPGDGYLGALVPPAPATWTTLLERFGTMSLADVLRPAIELAERGFPMYDSLHGAIAGTAERFREEWPTSAHKFLRDGEPPEPGTIWRQPALAATFRRLIEVESAAGSREAGLEAARGRFYDGDIAESIVSWAASNPVRDATGRENAALLTVEDLSGYSARVEEPLSVDYRGLQVHKCSSWTQGPVLLQALRLLEGFPLAEMGHNSADYIHTLVECMKLAFADREFYYGDPEFADVPFDRLLSRRYADERRELVRADCASMQLRPGGREPLEADDISDVLARFSAAEGDTTKLEVVDYEGNMISATPSGGWLMSSPVIPGVGFPLGTRGQMFSMAESHPNSLQPGKRPRMTLTPSLVTRDGAPWLAFGSPGGDCQDQWGLEFFLNVVEFGMSLQEAAEAPAFYTGHFPNSFYPRAAEPGVVHVEDRVPGEVRSELSNRGHIVKAEGPWSGQNAHAASFDAETRLICAAATPRRDTAYAMGF